MAAQHGERRRRWRVPPLKGEYAPVYVALGLIGLSAGIGLYTVKHQLMHAPNVSVSKRRRETVAEVAEPERVIHEANDFFNHSFFRSLAHVQDPARNYVVKDHTRADVFANPTTKALTLKDVGVDPILPPTYHHH